ncbi:MAG: hypothetical protein ACM3QW_03580, partial [Ignavibacteriales bacterium]
EFHWCSSDNDSLDAMVLPDQQIALIDGTAPHVVDPRNPGAVDEILNLGDFWNERQLFDAKNDILTLNQMVSKYFKIGYIRLREARAVWDEWAEYYADSIPNQNLNEIIREIKQTVREHDCTTSPDYWYRHLFASAVTPEGVVSNANTLFDSGFYVIALRGAPGIGMQKIMSSIASWGQEESLPMETYHSPFIPELTEMLIFREAKVIVIDASGILINHEPTLAKMINGRLYDLTQTVDKSKLLRFTSKIHDCTTRFSSALQGAVNMIGKAKETHDEMEAYYIPAMDFEQINIKREDLKKRILSYL